MTNRPIARALLAGALCLPGCANLSPTAPGAPRGAPEAWFQRGNERAELGELQAAAQAYRRALALGSHTRALHNLGLVQLRLGLQNVREALARLPPEHPAQQQTRDFVRLLLSAEL